MGYSKSSSGWGVTYIGEAIVTIGVATILIMEVCTPELAIPTERAHGAVR